MSHERARPAGSPGGGVGWGGGGTPGLLGPWEGEEGVGRGEGHDIMVRERGVGWESWDAWVPWNGGRGTGGGGVIYTVSVA